MPAQLSQLVFRRHKSADRVQAMIPREALVKHPRQRLQPVGRPLSYVRPNSTRAIPESIESEEKLLAETLVTGLDERPSSVGSYRQKRVDRLHPELLRNVFLRIGRPS